MSFESVADSLAQIRWSSAPEWSDRARELLLEYYRRLGPTWPPGRQRLEPADRAIEDTVMQALAPHEVALVQAAADRVLQAASERSERIEPTTQKLVVLILAWALQVAKGLVAAEADPGSPLLTLLDAGFQIQYTHAGIELWYDSGFMAVQVPVRPSN